MAEDKKALLNELWAIATTSPADLMEMENGELRYKDPVTFTKKQKAAIASLEKTAGGVKLKLYDKMKALELLGKCLGLFDSRPERETETNLLDTILAQTRKEVNIDDLPELQQTATDRHNLVESEESEGL